MANNTAMPKPRGTWGHRLGSHLLTVLLAMLVYWLLDMLTYDLNRVSWLMREEIEKRHVRQELVVQVASLRRQIDELARRIASEQEKIKVEEGGFLNIQRTMDQLIQLQRLQLEQKMAVNQGDQQNLNKIVESFRASHATIQQLRQNILDLQDKKTDVEGQLAKLEEELNHQRDYASHEFLKLQRHYQRAVAALQVIGLLALVGFGVRFRQRKPASPYAPVLLGLSLAATAKMVIILREHLPPQIFQYAMLAGLIVIVIRLLVYVVRSLQCPKKELLLRQFREAYEHFLCPVCEYPIRIGPRRFLYWTRYTVKKAPLAAGCVGRADETLSGEEIYTCPVCGTSIFEECPSCHRIRHAKLPFCSHCGAEKSEITTTGP
ncbi:MAG: hypothetical protein N2Z21_08090 [Candidatus Sumerlaeaceae bacterium]|nr:hypothetical protein [Candidatus Sumerlaeaceae bacterium]